MAYNVAAVVGDMEFDHSGVKRGIALTKKSVSDLETSLRRFNSSSSRVMRGSSRAFEGFVSTSMSGLARVEGRFSSFSSNSISALNKLSNRGFGGLSDVGLRSLGTLNRGMSTFLNTSVGFLGRFETRATNAMSSFSRMSEKVGKLGPALSKISPIASGVFSSMASHLSTAVSWTSKLALGLGVAATALAGLTIKKGFDVASTFEQNQIAFETMLGGNAEKAEGFITDLSAFAKKTPFELIGVQDSAKSLMAYGIESENVIDTLDTLGNIAAGVGTHKMGQLTLAYGQVRAATYLTGAELRQFTEAGVPLLDELAKQSGKSASQIKADMEAGVRVPFSEVQSALEAMSGEGGRFFNLMERQSQSLGGIVSNLKDTWALSMNQILQDSGAFELVKTEAGNLLTFLEDNEETITNFSSTILEKLTPALDTLKQTFIDMMPEQETVNMLLTFLKDEAGKLIDKITDELIPTLVENKDTLARFAGGGVLVALIAMQKFVDLIIFGIEALAWIEEKVSAVGMTFARLSGRVKVAVWWVKQMWAALKGGDGGRAVSATIGASGLMDKIGKVKGFATGVQNFQGGLAMVGERGPELLELPQGSNVYSNTETSSIVNNGEKTVNFYGGITVNGGGDGDGMGIASVVMKELRQAGV